jgi:hypothetical protein
LKRDHLLWRNPRIPVAFSCALENAWSTLSMLGGHRKYDCFFGYGLSLFRFFFMPGIRSCKLALAASMAVVLLLPVAKSDIAASADSLLPSVDEGRFRYATDYPAIGYSTVRPSERIAALQAKLDGGELALQHEDTRGYLRAVLEALGIDPASQLLVFSRTSVNVAHISPETPRAIYFNDDAYVAWVPGSGMLEIATMDPQLGPVFFTLDQGKEVQVSFDRQTVQCLRCHDSLTLTGGGVPRFILGSGYIDTSGNLVSHEGWILTTPETRLKFRWGGWYVTGKHGDQPHLGNIAVSDAAALQQLDSLRVSNLANLDGMIETQLYLSAYSDIVALLVIEHQVHVQNMITRVNYDVRTALDRDRQRHGVDNDNNEWSVSNETKSFIEDATEVLVQAMLFAGEAPLTSSIVGSTDFAEQFEARGPFDGDGRSLRQFDLRTRTFRYPLSYLVYSAAFDALPDMARGYIYRRFAEILGNGAADDAVGRLSSGERTAILEILLATKPAFATAIKTE